MVVELDPAFEAAYQKGRAKLRAGDFTGAEWELSEAVRLAKSASDRALAEQDRELAEDWSFHRRVLAPPVSPEEATTAGTPNVRTSDEIVSLYTNAVFYGIGTGAWLDTFESGNISSAEIVLPPLLAAGASVATVAFLDRGPGLRYGVAQSIVSGMYLGLEEGIAWSLWQTNQGGNWSGQTIASFIWVTTSVGAIAGGAVGEAAGTTPGRAAFVGSAGLWTGVLTGLTTAAITGGIASDSNAGSAPLAVAALGVTGGSIAGILEAGPVSPSVAHVRFIDLGGLAGFLVGGGLYLAGANGQADVHAFSGVAALGTAGGLAIAWYGTRSMPPDFGASEAPKTSGITWTPTIAPSPYGATIGVVGQM